MALHFCVSLKKLSFLENASTCMVFDGKLAGRSPVGGKVRGMGVRFSLKYPV